MRKPRQITGWRDSILTEFTPQLAEVSRLTVVSDPDGLLSESGIVQSIRDNGFEIVQFFDHVAFRFAYEFRFRHAWDLGEVTRLVVVLRTESATVRDLPFDLLSQARRESRVLEFSIARLFPMLAPNVMGEVEKTDFDALHRAVCSQKPGRMGENATRDFMLHYVFGTDVEALNTDADLLHSLIRKHYATRQRMPPSVEARLADLLVQRGRWKDWPLAALAQDRTAFFRFLDERWPIFVSEILRRNTDGLHTAESAEPYGLAYPGPGLLPFDDDHVRVYVDNLFIEGILTPTNQIARESVKDTWMEVGVAGSEVGDKKARLGRLLDRLEIPRLDASHLDWSQAAVKWAEATALRWGLPPEAIAEESLRFQQLHSNLDERFAAWLDEHYAPLHNLAHWPRPVMVHHVPHCLAHRRLTDGQSSSPSGQRIALVVMDGMALSQWILVRQALATDDVAIDDTAIFAWIPTLTGVSRQSIFYGGPPLYFGASIGGTQKEEQHWRRFWDEHGVAASRVEYICQKKQEDDESLLSRVKEKAQHPRCRVLGVVAGTVDQMMHGAVDGMDGLHARVQHWANRGWPGQLVSVLLSEGFEVTITADHGNTECIGIGKPNVGVVADERGERAHVFPDALTRGKTAGEFPVALEWPPHGLPDGYFPLLSRGSDAFITKGRRTVAHGGPSVEEVLVPYATIRKRA